jgi:cytoskeletal protein RodZ
MKEVGEAPVTQSERLAEIGRQLQEKRQEKNLSLAAIAEKIHVRHHLLEAIEAGKKETLPEPIYVREFIKKYAEAVGLRPLEASELAASYPLMVQKPIASSRWKFSPSLQLRPFHLYLLYILLVVVSVKNLGYLLEPQQLANRLQSSESISLTKPETPKTNKINPTQPAVARKYPKATAVEPVKDDKSATVEVTVKATSWIKIVADGKTVFEGNLPKGSRRIWTAKQQLTVSTGNAGGVLVAFNKGKAQQLGELGQVEEVTYKVKPEV